MEYERVELYYNNKLMKEWGVILELCPHVVEACVWFHVVVNQQRENIQGKIHSIYLIIFSNLFTVIMCITMIIFNFTEKY